MTTRLQKVFDNAVSHNGLAGKENEPEVIVDYKYVASLPSTSTYLNTCCAYEETSSKPSNKNENDENKLSSFLQKFRCSTRKKKGTKEIFKIKCLIDQDLTALLIHPVIHSFLTLKWQKAWPIFLFTLIFKLVFVFLLSSYINLPYFVSENGLNDTNATDEDYTLIEANETWTGPPLWFVVLFTFIVIMATLNGFLELCQILHTPKSQLRSLEPWITVGVFGLTITCMYPRLVWAKFEEFDDSFNNFNRSMTALGIFLAWVDVWMYMGRFPTIGMSIRVYHKVFHNFAVFILPHFCIMAGFATSLTIIFPKVI